MILSIQPCKLLEKCYFEGFLENKSILQCEGKC